MPEDLSTSNRAKRATYYPNSGSRMSPGLARARAPYRTKNAVTGLIVASFAIGTYFWSIRSVKQDDFSDLVAPSEEERRQMKSIEDEAREKKALKQQLKDDFYAEQQQQQRDVLPVVQQEPTSIWQRLTGSFGGKGADSSIVVGAPNVDNIGRLQDRTTSGSTTKKQEGLADKRWV